MSKYSFISFLKAHQVIVPEIQRDYAQGRNDKRTKEIRVSFVSDLITAIQSNKPLSLDFIFGKSIDINSKESFERNKGSLMQMAEVLEKFSKENNIHFEHKISAEQIMNKENRTFIPIDGQQRLTTLFLFHWYIGFYLKEDISLLKSFSYRTRESSNQFLKSLVTKTNNLYESEDFQDDIVDNIKNQKWFFKSWEKDPTVRGLLVTLSEIEKQFKDLYLESSCWNKLLNSEIISFESFDLEEHGLDDELYVKMNSRGEPLSDFENFKAWLTKKHKNIPSYTEFGRSLDKEWLDLFWKRTLPNKTDKRLMEFFKNIGLFLFLSKKQSVNQGESKKNKLTEEESQILKALDPDKFTPNSKFEKLNIFTESNIVEMFKILDILTDFDNNYNSLVSRVWISPFFDLSNKKFSEIVINEFSTLNNSDKIFIYSTLQFIMLTDKKHELDEEKFTDWLRISRNLIYNSYIDNDYRFIQAIRAIRGFGDNILDIKSYLKSAKEKKNWIKFFREEQQDEEWIKTNLLNSEWDEMIFNAENHFYFYGQIGFMLKLAEVEGGIYNFEIFTKYWIRLNNLFSTKHLNDLRSKFYIQRALLVAGGHDARWMYNITGSSWSFYRTSRANSRQRNENWRRLFNDSQKRPILKQLLDSIDGSTAVIDNYLKKNKESIKDWRRFFIEYPELFNRCGQMNIHWENTNMIRLLNAKRLNSSHDELRSYSLYLQLKDIFKVEYHRVSSRRDKPTIKLIHDNNIYGIYYDKDYLFKYYKDDPENYKDIDQNLPCFEEVKQFKSYILRADSME